MPVPKGVVSEDALSRERGSTLRADAASTGTSDELRGKLVAACATRIVAVAMVLALDCVQALALDPRKAVTDYLHDVWQTKDGLPQSSVEAIAQTPDGYLWLGTQEGLVRFDGVSFTLFHKGNRPGLRNDHITALLTDREGALWIGTHGGGVSRLSGGAVTTFTTEQGLLDDVVWVLCEGRDGSLWIGTGAGLSRLRGGRVLASYGTRDGLADEQVFSLHEDAKQRLWVGTRGGLDRLDGGQWRRIETGEGVQALREDRAGVLWAGTYHGLARVENDRLAAERLDGSIDGPITSLVEDRHGNLWIGSDQHGVGRVRDGKLSKYTIAQGLSDGSVYSLFEDREGSLWIGTTGGGLNRLKDGKFVTYGKSAGLSSDMIYAVLEDRRGRVWVSTSGGVDRLENGRFSPLPLGPGMRDDPVWSLEEDSTGNVWAGSRRGRLGHFENQRWIPSTSPRDPRSSTIAALFADREGSLWIGTLGGGLHRAHGGVSKESYRVAEGLPDDSITAIREAPGGLWIGTYAGGLSRFEHGQFASYSTKQGLSSALVTSLLPQEDGTLWIGTEGGGLNLFAGGRFIAYTTKEGLFDDTVLCILDDDLGSLWMSSNRGPFRVPKQELADFAAGRRASVTSLVYGVADGMRNPECNGGYQPACWKTRDGRLWFPTVQGLVVFDPRAPSNALPPSVVIEGAVVDGEPRVPDKGARLAAGTKRMELRYTATSLLAPGKVRFKYLLEGFDEDWNDAGGRREAAYTNLPPGRYRFRVIASNNDGVWNRQGAAWAFVVLPFFWQTAWFYALSGVLVASAAWGAHQLRVRAFRVRTALLEGRNRLAQEIHDNLSQVMTGLTLQLDAARDALDSGPAECRPYLERSSRLAQEGIEEIRRTVSGVADPAVAAGDLGSSLLQMVQRLVAGTGVGIEVSAAGRPSRVQEKVRQELFHIAQEAVTNALRHGGARKIEIALVYERKRVRLKVADDGCGFDAGAPAERPRGGLGLSGIRRRVTTREGVLKINSRPGGGTTLEVLIPLKGVR